MHDQCCDTNPLRPPCQGMEFAEQVIRDTARSGIWCQSASGRAGVSRRMAISGFAAGYFQRTVQQVLMRKLGGILIIAAASVTGVCCLRQRRLARTRSRSRRPSGATLCWSAAAWRRGFRWHECRELGWHELRRIGRDERRRDGRSRMRQSRRRGTDPPQRGFRLHAVLLEQDFRVARIAARRLRNSPGRTRGRDIMSPGTRTARWPACG